MLLVDDGSRDRTWELISRFSEENELVSGIKLAHNRGHQNALLAGLMTAKEYCDCAISLDADLQDDIEVLDQFADKFIDGCDVVYGVRNKRETDTFFKRTTAQGFYKFMAKASTAATTFFNDLNITTSMVMKTGIFSSQHLAYSG